MLSVFGQVWSQCITTFGTSDSTQPSGEFCGALLGKRGMEPFLVLLCDHGRDADKDSFPLFEDRTGGVSRESFVKVLLLTGPPRSETHGRRSEEWDGRGGDFP